MRDDYLEVPPIVTLSTADDFKTLKFHWERQPDGDRLKTINQVLSVEHTYESFEYLPDRSWRSFPNCNLSAPALDLLSCHIPSLSRLDIDLGEFTGYSASWDQAYTKIVAKHKIYSYAGYSYVDGSEIVCAIARFQNLRHLTLHYQLHPDQLALMHPIPGCEAARELFEAIQRQKRGQALVRLDVVFYAYSRALFGVVPPLYDVDPKTSNTMTVAANNDTFPQGGKQPQCRCTCDNPDFGKVIERRRRTERLYGETSRASRLGSVQKKLLHGEYRTLPWNFVMKSVMWFALLPSNFVFESGKRVRYEPSLANVAVSCREDYSKRRTRLKERFLEMILPYQAI